MGYPSLLHSMAGRARMLSERLSGNQDSRPGSEADFCRRQERWRKSVGGDAQPGLARRLALQGIGRAKADAALSDAGLVSPEPLPDWALFLEGCFRTAPAVCEPGSLPFDNLLAGLVQAAGRRLGATPVLSGPARSALLHSLASRLSGLCAETLAIEFGVFRALRGASPFSEPGSREQYDSFSAAFRLEQFFSEYPVLGRLAGQVCLDWVDRTREFLERLEAGREELTRTFGQLGPVTGIEPDRSDLHHRGRSVFIVRFHSGVRLVYKPRSLAVDRAFAGLQEWVNSRAAAPLRVLKLVDCGTHGWVEFAAAEPCHDLASAGLFYRRAGMLVALAHFLDGNDFHYENLIAAGDQPVLIDLETLCQHRRKAFEESNLAAAREFFETVIRTQLLPRWERGPGGRQYDISGLAGSGGQDAGFQQVVWLNVNTDLMRQEVTAARTPDRNNLPSLGGLPLDPLRFLGHIEDGFREVYSMVLENKTELLAPGGPLATFAGCPVRFIARATEHYELLLAGARKPRNLRDGRDYGMHFESLWRPLVMDERAAPLAPMVVDEIEALQRLDIPRLTARPESAMLELESGGVIAGHFQRPSIDAVRGLVANASEDDLERQLMFIRASLFTRFSRRPTGGAPRPGDSVSGGVTTRALEAMAGRIFDGIRRASIRARDGSAGYIAVCCAPDDTLQLQPLGPALYEGLAGVALFLAAFARVTGRGQAHELALATLMPVRGLIANPAEVPCYLREYGLGGLTGWGSIIYALLRCGTLLNDAALIEDAGRFAGYIQPADIRGGEVLDIVGGSAGLLMALLALHEHGGDARWLRLAGECGDHLISRSRQGAFPAREGRLLTGYSHGAAGVACALSRLARATGEERFAAAARAATAYEATVYRADERNWPDFRDGEGARCGISWCHGAPGIALSRLAMKTDHAALAAGLESTAALDRGPVDTVCCGTLGRAEILFTAGRMLTEPKWTSRARQLVAGFLRGDAAGDSRWMLSGGLYAPGFFQGASGAGYHLLRLAHPDSLPSVLLME